MTMTKDFSDLDLTRLLSQAKQPELPKGFTERLQGKLEVEPTSNVIAFPQKRHVPNTQRGIWLSAIPLAASLAVGIYLGAMADLPELFSGLQDVASSLTGESDLQIGIEDTESFLNGELS
jgi:hypothetical protein